jgi:hypothetical protein
MREMTTLRDIDRCENDYLDNPFEGELIKFHHAKSIHRVLELSMGLIENLVEKSKRQLHYQQHHRFDVNSSNRLITEARFGLLLIASQFVELKQPSCASTMIVTSFLMATIRVMPGILGEYSWRILDEVKWRSPYIVDEFYD